MTVPEQPRNDAEMALHLLSDSTDLRKPMTLAELRWMRETCDEPGCTGKRGEANKRLDSGGTLAPCPRCRGAGTLPDKGFDEKRAEIAAVVSRLVEAAEQAQREIVDWQEGA